MQANTQGQDALGLGPGSRGNSETLNVKGLKDAAPAHLRELRKLTARQEEFNEDVKAVCEANGANKAQYMKLLKASLKGKFEGERQKAEQQSIIFEAVGEVSDAGV